MPITHLLPLEPLKRSRFSAQLVPYRSSAFTQAPEGVSFQRSTCPLSFVCFHSNPLEGARFSAQLVPYRSSAFTQAPEGVSFQRSILRLLPLEPLKGLVSALDFSLIVRLLSLDPFKGLVSALTLFYISCSSPEPDRRSHQ